MASGSASLRGAGARVVIEAQEERVRYGRQRGQIHAEREVGEQLGDQIAVEIAGNAEPGRGEIVTKTERNLARAQRREREIEREFA